MLQQVIKRLAGNRTAPDRSPLAAGLGFTIRFAYPDDRAALHHLAALDSQEVPPGPLLVAEVGGELWAAVSLVGESRPIADPFHHTAQLVALLRERAEGLTRPDWRHRGVHPALSAATP